MRRPAGNLAESRPAKTMQIEELVKWLDVEIAGINRASVTDAGEGAKKAFLKTKEKIYEILVREGKTGPIELPNLDDASMCLHDRIRRDKALACNQDDLLSVADALRGLQSTDHPSLVPLHDKLMARYNQLIEEKNK